MLRQRGCHRVTPARLFISTRPAPCTARRALSALPSLKQPSGKCSAHLPEGGHGARRALQPFHGGQSLPRGFFRVDLIDHLSHFAAVNKALRIEVDDPFVFHGEFLGGVQSFRRWPPQALADPAPCLSSSEPPSHPPQNAADNRANAGSDGRSGHRSELHASEGASQPSGIRGIGFVFLSARQRRVGLNAGDFRSSQPSRDDRPGHLAQHCLAGLEEGRRALPASPNVPGGFPVPFPVRAEPAGRKAPTGIRRQIFFVKNGILHIDR